MGIHEDTLQGLQEALDYIQGDKSKARSKVLTMVNIKPLKEYSGDDIKALRNKNNMTQCVFAEVLGVTQKAVEAWEAGTNKPTGTAIRLFQLLEEDRDSVLEHIVIKQ